MIRGFLFIEVDTPLKPIMATGNSSPSPMMFPIDMIQIHTESSQFSQRFRTQSIRLTVFELSHSNGQKDKQLGASLFQCILHSILNWKVLPILNQKNICLLVNVYTTMENHHFSRKSRISTGPFSSRVSLPETINSQSQHFDELDFNGLYERISTFSGAYELARGVGCFFDQLAKHFFWVHNRYYTVDIST